MFASILEQKTCHDTCSKIKWERPALTLTNLGHPTQRTSHLTQSTKQTSDWCYDPWWKLSQCGWGEGGDWLFMIWEHVLLQFYMLLGCNVRLIDNGPLSFVQGRLSSTSSFNASLLQAVSGVISLALCLQVVSQASQHFSSSEKQAISKGCFVHQSICSVISLHRLEKTAHLHWRNATVCTRKNSRWG